MATISLLTRLVGGVQRQVDLSVNTLWVQDLQLNNSSGWTLAGITSGHAGSSLIGDDATYSNFTPASATVKGALTGIDAALAATGSTQLDGTFRIENTSDPTKKIAFDASGISTATTRTISMPDANVNLGLIATAIQRNGSVTFTANQPMGGFILTGLGAGTTAGNSVRYEQAILISGVNAFAANQPMGGFKLTGLGAGTGTGDSVRYEQAILASGVNPWTANQSLGGFKITNAADPTAAQDYVTKAYADALASGLDPKASVRAATTAALPAVTYNNGTGGVGATLTANANGTIPAQDGTTMVNGNRLLVKNQVAALQNGIYVVTDIGSGGTPFILTRATDQDGSPANEVSGGNFTFVETGTLNSGAGWTVIWDGNVTVGTDPMNWSQFSSITFIGGDMITITGNTISVDLATASGLESTNPGNIAGQLRIKLEASNPSLKFTGSNELAAKLDAAGAIVSGASGLGVSVDGSTIEINSNALRVKDLGITLAKLAANSVDENKIVSTSFNAAGAITGGSGTKIAVQVDNSSIEINTNALRIKTTAYDQATITGGGGSAAAVAYAPALKESFVAGESFAAATLFAVRMAKAADSGFVAGRVYKADNDATTVDNFWVIGLVLTAGISAGGSALVVKSGAITATAHGFTVGTPVFLGASGAITNTAPSTANLAVLKVGMVRDANTIEVQIGSPYVN